MANFYKKSQSGRSMVEMLGVLAIIGILSLVSISAYSAAMFKYELNKYTEDFSTFLNGAISLLPDIRRQYGHGNSDFISIGGFLADTSLLPDSMRYDKDKEAIYDLFKNRNSLDYHFENNTTTYRLIIHMQRSDDKISARDRAICRNVFLVAKENYDNICSITMYNSANAGGSSSSSGFIGGLAKWNGRSLKDAGLSEIDDACNYCNSKSNCSIVIYLISEHIN